MPRKARPRTSRTAAAYTAPRLPTRLREQQLDVRRQCNRLPRRAEAARLVWVAQSDGLHGQAGGERTLRRGHAVSQSGEQMR